MPRFAWMRWVLLPVAAALAGCQDLTSAVMKGQLQQSQQQQLALSRQAQELQNRVNALDRDNQEKEVKFAQAQQQAQAAEEQLAAVKEQLASVTRQLAQARQEQQSSESKVQALNASLNRRGGVSIRPNSSLQEDLPAVNLPGVYVRRDGDMIRVELPGNTLFPTADGRVSPEGVRLVLSAAGEIARAYPEQRIGVEGHTGKDPLPAGRWQSHHHLAFAEAMAVFDVLSTRTSLKATQLVVAGHGGNYPVVSNGPSEGKQRNHRVELVIYPDKVAG